MALRPTFTRIDRNLPTGMNNSIVDPYRIPQFRMIRQSGSTGTTPAYPTVIDWPYASDSSGVAFDQANLYGVRTAAAYSVLGPSPRDVDEANGWVAVPKTLPSGYTYQGRVPRKSWTTGFPTRTPLQSPHTDDMLGNNPMWGPSASVPNGTQQTSAFPIHRRTTDSLLPAVCDEPGSAYRGYPGSRDYISDDGLLWTPMNYEQQVVNVSALGQNYGSYNDLSASRWNQVVLLYPHIGFRGIKYSVTVGVGITADIQITAHTVPTSFFTSPPPSPPYGTTVYTNSHTNGTFNVVASADIFPALDGKRHMFSIWTKKTGSIIGWDGGFLLSPRTDVPMHYSMTGAGDRHAPGGYCT